ncbi:hypothetical protein PGH42_07635 [Legionella pneumophila]|nr:hypothetical protein PGH42_07635 [Legionella pneumophila]
MITNNIRFNSIIFSLLFGLLSLLKINLLHADDTGEKNHLNLENYSPQTKKLCQSVAYLSVPSQNQLDEASKASLKTVMRLIFIMVLMQPPIMTKPFNAH